MRILVIVNHAGQWPLCVPGVEVVTAKTYLTDPFFTGYGCRVFNLCRSYRYQSTGYYVSLLAEARGHRPIPDVGTVCDLQSPRLWRLVTGDLDDLIQRSLSRLQGDRFDLSIYFGRNMAKRYERLSLQLFNLFRAPLLRASFLRKDQRWVLKTIGPIGFSGVPEKHQPFLLEAATGFFRKGRRGSKRRKSPRYSMAVLCNDQDATPPSNPRALKLFAQAGDRLGIALSIIGKDEIHRIPEFDGLFIRETTQVNNHTYRFSRRAEAEGLVVIDDPDSIVKCTNKVYLAERLHRSHIATPKTMLINRQNLDAVLAELGTPCILKQPDGSCSIGVIKVDTAPEFLARAEAMLRVSDLIIAQEFIPTPFDWRVGIIDGKPLYVCKYFMAGKHWQIVDRSRAGRIEEGKVETLPVHAAPANVVRTALRAANLIGRSLYGVDLKTDGRACRVIEINDNPSIDAGFEDRFLKDELYTDIMKVFLQRMEAAKR